jgi:hypothetical protein
MSPSGASAPWCDFTQDPRSPHAAALRASDRDRDVALGVLSEGYADGRLTREEYDERAGVAAAAKTLGDLPPLILDLVPQTPSGAQLSTGTSEALHTKAVEHWQCQRRKALTGLLIPTVICWAIWVMSGLGAHAATFHAGFPWPLFVMLGTGAHLTRVLLNRQVIVETERRRLEKRQRKALDRPRSSRPRHRPDAG